MALERDPWSRVIYKGFAKSAAEAKPGYAPKDLHLRLHPNTHPRRSRRTGLAVAGFACLVFLIAAVVAGLPTFARLWPGVPLQAALPRAFEPQAPAPAPAPVQAAAPATPSPAAAKPITVAAIAPPAPPLDVEPPVAKAPTHLADAEPPKPGRRIERRRPGMSAEARERASEATAAANLAATIAPESTLSGQVASQAGAPFLSHPQ